MCFIRHRIPTMFLDDASLSRSDDLSIAIAGCFPFIYHHIVLLCHTPHTITRSHGLNIVFDPIFIMFIVCGEYSHASVGVLTALKHPTLTASRRAALICAKKIEFMTVICLHM